MPTPPKSPETLRAIELLLLWEGTAGNERMRELFDLHFTTVSRLLSQYEEMNPVGMAYSTVQRRWVADADFSPLLTSGTIDEYLALTLTERKNGASPVIRTQLDFGRVGYREFGLFQRAIREGAGLVVEHSSLRHPAPTLKTVFPHALVEAGRRWHVRAYVLEAEAFRDLALTRLWHVQPTSQERPAAAEPSADTAWRTNLNLRVVPHPALTAEQKQLVRTEYFGGAAARTEVVRAALLSYVIQDLHAALDPGTQQPPEYQLCVDGATELASWLMPSAFEAPD